MLEAERSTADGERGQEQMKGSKVSHQSLLCPDLIDLFSSLEDPQPPTVSCTHTIGKTQAKALFSDSESKVQNVFHSFALII